jgi:4-amino-4-deoxy-L-arabinose transferase-like glycosyltransferase
VLAALVVGTYFFQLGQNPPGLWVDETSVGYNARAIARTGADEYGTRWPLFFRAFEDYKSPILLYATAPSVGLLGPTPFALRLVPALFGLSSAAVLLLLLRRLTGRPRLARWLALLAALAPCTFSFARHSVSETCTVGLMLGLSFLALERWAAAPSAARAALTGGLMALCSYAYTTQRMFAPMMIVVAGLLFLADPRTRRTIWAFGVAAAVVTAPYAAFLLMHRGALTRRFDELSIFRDHPAWTVAAGRFAQHYLDHLVGLDFLFRTGDPNLRHNIGTGFLPLWMAAPLVLGLWSLWRRRREKLPLFFLVLMPLAPIPVALTHAESLHASRMTHFFPLALIACAFALSDFIERARPRIVVLGLMTCAALFESEQFLYRYFAHYPAAAQDAFDYGEGAALQVAFAARRSDEKIFAPNDFFAFDGIRFKYFGDVDPARSRQEMASLGFFRVDSVERLPAGSIAILPGDSKPRHGEPAEPLGVSPSARDHRPAFTVWRITR